MGNQNSSTSSAAAEAERIVRPFVRHVGALGLSRAELDKRCQPSGLYNSCPWDDRAIRKLIGDGRIAARLVGKEYRYNETEQECPICFLYYTEVNITKCCNAYLCTECFLQVRPQKEKQSSCPFCNCDKFSVTVAEKPSEEDIGARDKEEQTVIEARIRATVENSNGDAGGEESSKITTPPATKKKNPASVAPDSPASNGGFGSELEKDERFQLFKKRSESFASNEGNRTPQKDTEIIQSIAMTPEERRRLEEEMRAQHSHPLSLQIEAEAQERRLQNEQAYYRSNSTGSSRMRAQRAADLFRSNSSNAANASRRLRYRGVRDWNQIVESFERGGNGEGNSLDDLVVLEAAILLSMEEEARRSRDGEELDAARHARDGFPLVRSFLGGSMAGSFSLRGEGGSSSGNTGSSGSGPTSENIQNLVRSLSSGRRRNQIPRSGLGSSARARGVMPEAALDTATLMMRGISEEEQIAMAIAASLQDQSAGNSTDGVEGNEEENASPPDSGGGSSTSDGEGMDGRVSSNAEDLQVESAAEGVVVDQDAAEALPTDRVSSDTATGVEATTITELARVVTDGATAEPNSEGSSKVSPSTDDANET